MKKNNHKTFKLKQVQPYPNTFKVEFVEKPQKTKVSTGNNVISFSETRRQIVVISESDKKGKFISVTKHERMMGKGEWKYLPKNNNKSSLQRDGWYKSKVTNDKIASK